MRGSRQNNPQAKRSYGRRTARRSNSRRLRIETIESRLYLSAVSLIATHSSFPAIEAIRNTAQQATEQSTLGVSQPHTLDSVESQETDHCRRVVACWNLELADDKPGNDIATETASPAIWLARAVAREESNRRTESTSSAFERQPIHESVAIATATDAARRMRKEVSLDATVAHTPDLEPSAITLARSTALAQRNEVTAKELPAGTNAVAIVDSSNNQGDSRSTSLAGVDTFVLRINVDGSIKTTTQTSLMQVSDQALYNLMTRLFPAVDFSHVSPDAIHIGDELTLADAAKIRDNGVWELSETGATLRLPTSDTNVSTESQQQTIRSEFVTNSSVTPTTLNTAPLMLVDIDKLSAPNGNISYYQTDAANNNLASSTLLSSKSFDTIVTEPLADDLADQYNNQFPINGDTISFGADAAGSDLLVIRNDSAVVDRASYTPASMGTIDVPSLTATNQLQHTFASRSSDVPASSVTDLTVSSPAEFVESPLVSAADSLIDRQADVPSGYDRSTEFDSLSNQSAALEVPPQPTWSPAIPNDILESTLPPTVPSGSFDYQVQQSVVALPSSIGLSPTELDSTASGSINFSSNVLPEIREPIPQSGTHLSTNQPSAEQSFAATATELSELQLGEMAPQPAISPTNVGETPGVASANTSSIFGLKFHDANSYSATTDSGAQLNLQIVNDEFAPPSVPLMENFDRESHFNIPASDNAVAANPGTVSQRKSPRSDNATSPQPTPDVRDQSRIKNDEDGQQLTADDAATPLSDPAIVNVEIQNSRIDQVRSEQMRHYFMLTPELNESMLDDAMLDESISHFEISNDTEASGNASIVADNALMLDPASSQRVPRIPVDMANFVDVGGIQPPSTAQPFPTAAATNPAPENSVQPTPVYEAGSYSNGQYFEHATLSSLSTPPIADLDAPPLISAPLLIGASHSTIFTSVTTSQGIATTQTVESVSETTADGQTNSSEEETDTEPAFAADADLHETAIIYRNFQNGLLLAVCGAAIYVSHERMAQRTDDKEQRTALLYGSNKKSSKN